MSGTEGEIKSEGMRWYLGSRCHRDEAGVSMRVVHKSGSSEKEAHLRTRKASFPS